MYDDRVVIDDLRFILDSTTGCLESSRSHAGFDQLESDSNRTRTIDVQTEVRPALPVFKIVRTVVSLFHGDIATFR
jgi:hypothetical protein